MKLKIFATILIFSMLALPVQVHSIELASRSALNLDESILSDNNLYANPEEILIVPITIDKNLGLTDSEWYRGLYYYTVDRLGFGDMPYHYIVTESGNIFKGNKYGDEKEIQISDFNSHSVIIGYLNKGNTTSIDPRAEKVLKDLILQIANYNNINPSKTSVRTLKFKRDKENKTLQTIAEKAYGSWENSVAKLVGSITGFSPIPKEYKADVIQITAPTEEVDPGQEVNISIKLKNSGNNGNYSDSDSELLLTKSGSGASIFYLNNIWLSQTQTSIMETGQNFLPNQESTFNFKVKAPLYVGEVSENFDLHTFSGAKLQAPSIEVKIKVRKTDKQIVSIKNNAAGYSNIYYQAYTSSGVALRAVSGERFFLLEENLQTLWAKLDLGNGQIGYIAVWNLNFL